MKVFGKYVMAFTIASLLIWGSAAEAKLDTSSLKQPHPTFYYLHEGSVNFNTKEQKERAYQLIATGEDIPLGIEVINKVIAVDKNDSEAYLIRAYAYSETKEYYSADNDYENALMLEPENPTFYYLRGMNYLGEAMKNSRGYYKYNEAERMFKKALALEPNYINSIVAIGDVYYYQGYYKDAINYYNRVLVLYPQHDTVLAKKEDANEGLRREAEKERIRELRNRIN